MDPTVAGYLAFIRNVMGISTGALPDNTPVIGYSYASAKMRVNPILATVPCPDVLYPTYYAYAIYNFAADRLVNFAPDQTGSTYFKDLREALNITGFVGGVIQSSSDESTSQSMLVPNAMAGLTFNDLQMMKTPWGREYLGLAQAYGPSVWGSS